MKIALLSDIHFGGLARTDEFTINGEASKDHTVGAVSITDDLCSKLINENVEYILIAGDLTSTGSPLEFYGCEKKILEVAEKSSISKDRVIWGVGNHDLDWKVSELGENFSEFDIKYQEIAKEKYRIIASAVAEKNMDVLIPTEKPGPVPLSGIAENEKFIVFVLNTAMYCTKNQKFSHGKLGDKQLSWFRASTKEYDNDNRWKIVLMHHHAYNYPYHIAGIDISMIEEGSELLEIIGEAGIDIVCHGHRHHPKAETVQKTGWKKPVTFVCAGSLSVNAEHRSSGDIPNTFHIINISERIGVFDLINYQYSSSEGWIPFRSNSPETPLDPTMRFGKIISEEQLCKQIYNLAGAINEKQVFTWNSLIDDFHYCSYDRVNKKIKELLSEDFNIIGAFPNEVLLQKKGDQK